jgi:hypothetical protein
MRVLLLRSHFSTFGNPEMDGRVGRARPDGALPKVRHRFSDRIRIRLSNYAGVSRCDELALVLTVTFDSGVFAPQGQPSKAQAREAWRAQPGFQVPSDPSGPQRGHLGMLGRAHRPSGNRFAVQAARFCLYPGCARGLATAGLCSATASRFRRQEK